MCESFLTITAQSCKTPLSKGDDRISPNDVSVQTIKDRATLMAHAQSGTDAGEKNDFTS